MITKRLIAYQGEMIPKYYGVAYYEPDRDMVVLCLMPINLIVRLLHEIHWWMKQGFGRGQIERSYSKGYNQGVRHGWDIGFKDGQKEIRYAKRY